MKPDVRHFAGPAIACLGLFPVLLQVGCQSRGFNNDDDKSATLASADTKVDKAKWGIKSSMDFPEATTNPSKQEAEAEEVCAHAASAETFKHCKWMAQRNNHITALASAINDDAATKDLGGIEFTKGWFPSTKNTCVAVQSTAMSMSSAIKATRSMETNDFTAKLQKLGWKKFTGDACAGIRPGDIVFTFAEKPDLWHPAHMFMFYDWNGRPKKKMTDAEWNQFWSKASRDTDPSDGRFKRFALAIDNNRGTKKYKYFRPMMEKDVSVRRQAI